MQYIPATKARKNFFQLLKQASQSGNPIFITHMDLQPVVMMSADEYEGWMETMDILSDPEEAKAIREAMKSNKNGEDTITLEELQKKIG